ncbi:MAG: hypothetical protein ABIP53_04965 [Candidatus Limnocylindrales bacterium]
MAWHERTTRFRRDWHGLVPEERNRFAVAFLKFDHDLAEGRFRVGLRVKRVQGTTGAFEMTWAANGRATFQYGEPESNEPHIVWRRIGTHEVFRRP